MTEGRAGERLQLGYVAGVHGVRGGLRVKLFNPDSNILEAGCRVWLVQAEGGAAENAEGFEVARVSPKPGSALLRLWLVGVDGREAAEELRGRQLWVSRRDLPELADDEFYLADLIGLEVRRAKAGAPSLGTVVGVTSSGAQDLLSVRLGGREWLLPAIAPFIVDLQVDADPPLVIVDVHDDLLPDGAVPRSGCDGQTGEPSETGEDR